MKILAIDCCLKLTGAALMIDEKISCIQDDLGRRQSQELPLMTEKLLRENNITWRDLDFIALTNGPGYFTGIRVGASYSAGLAYACGKKIIPVSSLEFLLHSYKTSELTCKLENKKLLALIYAGHGYVYALSASRGWSDWSYLSDGSDENFLSAGEYSHEQINSWLAKNPDAIIISDDPSKTFEQAKKVSPDLKALCRIAAENLDRAVNPMELKISYYREPQGINNYL